MNTQTIWRPQEVPIADPVTHNQVVLENRLSTLRDVALTLLREVESLRVGEPVKQRVRLHDEVQRFEVELINSALSRSHGNQTQAAKILGVKLTTLNSKIKRYKIPLEEYGSHAEMPRENAA
jgi:transcriptional regulator with GAF, ATPase, and Fis domain